VAIVTFTASDLANGRYEDDELTTQGIDQHDGALVVVRADGALAIALRGFALREQGCTVPVRPAQILSRTPPTEGKP
jgi:hypothetical protein